MGFIRVVGVRNKVSTINESYDKGNSFLDGYKIFADAKTVNIAIDFSFESSSNLSQSKSVIRDVKTHYIVELSDYTFFIEKYPIAQFIRKNEREIHVLLEKINIPKNLKGHKYIFEAIALLSSNDEETVDNIVDSVYKEIAHISGVSWRSVRKAISHCIKNSIDTTEPRIFETILEWDGKIDNQETLVQVFLLKFLDSLVKTFEE